MNFFSVLLTLLVVVTVTRGQRSNPVVGERLTEICWEAQKGTGEVIAKRTMNCKLQSTDFDAENFAVVSASLINLTDANGQQQKILFNVTVNLTETSSISFNMTSEGSGQPIGFVSGISSSSFGGLPCFTRGSDILNNVQWVVMECETHGGSVNLLSQKVMVTMERRANEGSNVANVSDESVPVVDTAKTIAAHDLFPIYKVGDSLEGDVVTGAHPLEFTGHKKTGNGVMGWVWVGVGLLIVVVILSTISYRIHRQRARTPKPEQAEK